MKVLHCIYDDPTNPWVGGGGALRVFELYRRLATRLDVTVATGNFPGARDETIEGIRYVRLGVPRPYAASRLTYGASATRMLARGDYDAAVFDFSGYTPIRIPAGRPVGVVVHMLHGPTAAGRWGRSGGRAVAALERAMLRRAREVCVTSKWLGATLAQIVSRGARFHVVSSGVPDEFFAVERREAGYLLYYGRFDVYQKGLDLLLDAIAHLKADGSTTPLRLLGRGKDAAQLRARIDALGLRDVVTIEENPDRPAVLTAMAGALALVHPSRFEGLPMVPAEAMAAGVPVIATDVGAVSEILAGGDAGVLIAADNVAAIAEHVRRLIGDAERRHVLSAKARESARRYEWSRVAEDHRAFLEAVAASRRAA